MSITISVYVSYAWEPESEEMLHKLEKEFDIAGINLIYDKKSTKFKDKIKGFMDTIGEAKHIVIIISDKYMRSKNCMYELLVIYENGDFDDRIYPIVLSSAKIYEVTDVMRYVKHWEDKITEFEELYKSISPRNTGSLITENDLYTKIRSQLPNLIAILQNINTLSPEIHKQESFRDIIEAIKKNSRTDILKNEDAKLLRENPKEFVRSYRAELIIERSLSNWLKRNKKKLIEKAINKLLESNESAFKAKIQSKKLLPTFKKSIEEHFTWLIECFDKLDSDIPLDNHVNKIDLRYRHPELYKIFFITLLTIISDPNNQSNLLSDEEALLLEFMEYLAALY